MKTLAILSLAAVATASLANLLPNSSFETNTANTGHSAWFGDIPDQWSNFTDVHATATPDMWDNTGTDGNAPGTSGFMPHVAAFHGDNWVGIASETSNGGFSEGIESSQVALVGSQTYTFSMAMIYDEHNTGGYTGAGLLTIRLRQGAAASTILGTFASTGPDQWETRSLDFTPGASDNYSIIISNENSVRNYVGIDAANLEAVPEPATMVALGLGAAALIRRRKK